MLVCKQQLENVVQPLRLYRVLLESDYTLYLSIRTKPFINAIKKKYLTTKLLETEDK